MLNPHTVIITFDATGGSLLTAAKRATPGDTVGRLPIPTRNGYEFLGWRTAADGTEAFGENSTVPDSDITLYAAWKASPRSLNKGKKRKKSLVRLEKIALICVPVIIAALVITLICTNRIVNETEFIDTDGTHYFIRTDSDGLYAAYFASGEELTTDCFGYYKTAAGTAVYVNADDGTYKIITDVVYPEDGEDSASSSRVRLFEKISKIQSIEVSNDYGTYSFVLDGKSGKYVIKGHEYIAYDETLFAYLRSVCGNTIMIEKIDSPIKDANGTFSEYGLTVTKYTDENGETVTKKPASFTVVGTDGTSHTVLIGDKILSGNGYYVQLVGRDAVYIADNSYYDQTVMCGIESLVIPLTVNMSGSYYYDVRDFILAQYAYEKDPVAESETITSSEILTAFSFIPSDERKDYDSTRPYKLLQNYVEGYYAYEDNIYRHVLMQFYNMTYERVCMIGFNDSTKEDLEKYGLLNYEYLLTFDSYSDYIYDTENKNVFLDSEGNYVYYMYSSQVGGYVYVYIGSDGQMTLYTGAASELSSPYVLEDKNGNHVYFRYIESLNACRYVYLDENGKFIRYYSESDGDLYYAPDWVQNILVISSKTENDTYYVGSFLYDMVVEIESKYLDFLTWDSVKWVDKYPIYLDIGYVTEVRLSSGNENYYFIVDNSKSDTSDPTASISEKLEAFNGMTGEAVNTQLFREFFRTMLYTQIYGTVDLSEQEMENLRNQDDSECIAILSYKTTCGDEFVFRFYKYEDTGLNAYMTINGNGIYYIKTSWLKVLLNNAYKVVNNIPFTFSDN